MITRDLQAGLTCAALFAGVAGLASQAAQTPAPPRQGHAYDEQNKGRTDEVQPGQTGFVTIFDGRSMNGWSVSAKSRHSSVSGNKTGGAWQIRDGVLLGTQDVPGNGGLFITDRKYGDFEVVLEMRNDFGIDSGIYLRSTDTGTAYQIMIDYRRWGALGGVYGENMKPGFNVAPFNFTDAPDRIFLTGNAPMPVLPAAWPSFWRHGQWNEFRARIVGNPAHVTTWINGVQFLDWTDTMPRLADGFLALQVHGGLEWVQGKDWVGVDGSKGGETDFTKRSVRYRNIRLKELP
ncbi:MAG: DUF1080 domain-containing protein [Acidobacteria bacterium]|nr:DUF1080 domain-containing protein [Acidobacteriota bacterium]